MSSIHDRGTEVRNSLGSKPCDDPTKAEWNMSSTETLERGSVADEVVDALFDMENMQAIIVWDDPVTTFEQVIRACVELLGHSRARARRLADQVDSTGKAVVGIRPRDEAIAIVREFHRRVIQASCEPI